MCIIPSLRFLLTIHDIPHTYVYKLDTYADSFLKKWSGLPKCATNTLLHANNALNIMTISHLYKEAHCTSHAATRLKGDEAINRVLDNKIQRETKFTKKKSITVIAENIF